MVREKRNRRIRTVVGALVVAGIVVGVIALVSGGSKKSTVAAATTTTVASTSTTTTTVPVAAKGVAPVCPPATGSTTRVTAFTHAPPTCVPANAVYDATFRTDVGSFTVEMHVASSPVAVNNFVFLARYRFYNGTVFHRVIPSFVVQGGDPTGTGTGGPGYSFTGNTPPKSCTAAHSCYVTGSVAMANSGTPSSDGSQFFVVLPGGASDLSDNYTTIGQVTSGMSVVERIGADGSSSGTPKVLHHLISVTITEVTA